jgi:hypothetical protein
MKMWKETVLALSENLFPIAAIIWSEWSKLIGYSGLCVSRLVFVTNAYQLKFGSHVLELSCLVS